MPNFSYIPPDKKPRSNTDGYTLSLTASQYSPAEATRYPRRPPRSSPTTFGSPPTPVYNTSAASSSTRPQLSSPSSAEFSQTPLPSLSAAETAKSRLLKLRLSSLSSRGRSTER